MRVKVRKLLLLLVAAATVAGLSVVLPSALAAPVTMGSRPIRRPSS